MSSGGSLVFVGLGLGDLKDVTIRGLEEIKSSDYVFLENYTAILPGTDLDQMEAFYGKKIILADRDMVEQQSADIIDHATRGSKVSILVVGDPFCATTHSDLFLRAKQLGIAVSIVHNASIISAIGCTGMHMYRFGEIVTIPYWTDNWKPASFFDKIIDNKRKGLHTLCLLDIKVKERSLENLIKNRNIFEPPRFMSVFEALTQMVDVVHEAPVDVVTMSTQIVGVARIGKSDQTIKFGTIAEFMDHLADQMGGPLHSLIVCGDLHEMESEFLEQYK